MIDVTDVGKSYGPIQALKGVSFHVDAGEVIGLLGPNGAGKTTMIKILTGYLQPDSGRVMVDGLDVLTDTLEVQKRIGYLPENAPLYPEMSVQAYLRMMAELRQIPAVDQPAYLSSAIRATGLEDHLTRPIGELSKGYRQRVGLAQAVLHKPKLLILDEPAVGLDPTQIVEVRRLIRRLAHRANTDLSCTVLISTHILSEVEATCERVIILLNGEIRADASLSDLSATTDVILVLGEGAPDATADLNALSGVRAVEVTSVPDGREYRIRGAISPRSLSEAHNTSPQYPSSLQPLVLPSFAEPRAEGSDEASSVCYGADLRPFLYELARDKGWPLRELRREVRTLETVFSELTRDKSAFAR